VFGGEGLWWCCEVCLLVVCWCVVCVGWLCWWVLVGF
jgi:hypothetical protein